MKPDDSTLVLGGVGLLALWAGLTDAIYRYVRPTMRPWLVIAGVVLIALALAGYGVNRRDRKANRTSDGGAEGDHEHRLSRVGWLLALPIVIALAVDPGALGAYAVGRQSSLRAPPAFDFDLASYLRSHSTGGQTPELTELQLMLAASHPDDRELLATTSVALIGFVAHEDGERPGSFLLARVLVGCCAGDGTPIPLEVRGYHGHRLPDDTWVRVTARLDVAATHAADKHGQGLPVLSLESLDEIDDPSQPYLYPG